MLHNVLKTQVRARESTSCGHWTSWLPPESRHPKFFARFYDSVGYYIGHRGDGWGLGGVAKNSESNRFVQIW